MGESYYNGNYTGAEIDAGIAAANAAAPQATTYTKSEVDAKFQEVDANIDALRLMMGATVYGFRIDKNNSDPETRVEYLYDAVGMTPARMNYTTGVFDYGSWANAWFITGNKPCALKYDGTVDYYLDPNDYTKKADGTESDVSNSEYEGNFMASMPTVWIRRWEDNRYQYVAIASRQISDDFKAYAHMSEDEYVNPFVYFPMFKGSKIDDKMRSIAGQYPQANTDAPDTFTLARANGNDWYNWTLSGRAMINDLLTLISKTTNSQTAFGNGVMYNSGDTVHYGQIETGTGDLDTGQFFGYGGEEYAKHMKAFHIEDYWGNRTDRILGMHLNQGLYKYKLTPPYHPIGEGGLPYIQTTLECADLGYIVEMYIGDFGFLPKPSETSGSASIYWCDYFNTSKTTNNRVAVSPFSSRVVPTRQGYTGLSMDISWDYAGPNNGGSLVYIPPHST